LKERPLGPWLDRATQPPDGWPIPVDRTTNFIGRFRCDEVADGTGIDRLLRAQAGQLLTHRIPAFAGMAN
jgi:hypothetical protein